MRARQYVPAWGRFASPDPLSFSAAPSLYSFTGSRPLAARDPSGMLPNDEKWVRQWMASWDAPFAAPWDLAIGGGLDIAPGFNTNAEDFRSFTAMGNMATIYY